MSILDPAFFEPIACETENGFVGSFKSNISGAGTTELSIRNGNTIYIVNLIASETGELLVKWTEVFTVLMP